jgi:hypothetical protein
VDLHLLGAREGGRVAKPIRSGYRALARFRQDDDLHWAVGVTITFAAPPVLAPGDSAVVRLTTWTDPPPLVDGAAIRLYDGTQLIATGTVR